MDTDFSDYTLTSGQVATALGVTQDTIARWADRGDLRCIKTLGKWRKFRQADVDAFLADNGGQA